MARRAKRPKLSPRVCVVYPDGSERVLVGCGELEQLRRMASTLVSRIEAAFPEKR